MAFYVCHLYGTGEQRLECESDVAFGSHFEVWVAIMVVTFWWTGGYFVVLYAHAVCKTSPDELKEAARIDGANGVQTLVKIIIPYMKPTHLLIMFLQVIASFKLYGQPHALLRQSQRNEPNGDPVYL